MIDAGHGYDSATKKGDTGATNGGLYESAVTIAVAKILANKLKSAGFEINLTRKGNEFLTLKERCKLSNEWGAQVFISIHCNSAENKVAQGIETWKCVNSNNPFAVNIQKRLIEATGAKNRGVKDGTFYVLKNTRCKAVLVEIGFISHEEEKELLFKTSYQTKIADAIVQGVQDTLKGSN